MITLFTCLLVVIIILLIFIFFKQGNKYGWKPLNKDPKSPLYLVPIEKLNKATIFPWSDVMQCNFVHHVNENYKPCPLCNEEKTDSAKENIFWVYFKSPRSTWKNLCGREGYLSICSKHKIQVDFECTLMN